MKTYIKTTWNWFRLLALGSILVCANSLRANAATTPHIVWPAFSSAGITYPNSVSGAMLSATATNDSGIVITGSNYFHIVGYPTPAGAIDKQVQAGITLDANEAPGWTVKLDFTPDASYGTAYTTATASQILVVKRDQLVIQMNNKSRRFGETNPVLDGVLTAEAGFFAPLSSDNLQVAGNTIAVPSTQVGTYTIGGSLVIDSVNRAANYAISRVISANLTINPVPITITPKVAALNYYGSSNFFYGTDTNYFTVSLPPEVQYRTDLTNIAAVIYLAQVSSSATNLITSNYLQAGTYTYFVTNVFSRNATAGLQTPGGKQPVQDGYGGQLPNYTVVSNHTQLVVSKVPLTLTVTNQTWEYGQFGSFTGLVAGVKSAADSTYTGPSFTILGKTVNTDDKIIGFDDSTNLTFIWNASVPPNQKPGVYGLSPAVTDAAAAPNRLSRNYDPVQLIPGQVTITKKKLEWTWDPPAANKVITYGALLTSAQTNAVLKQSFIDAYPSPTFAPFPAARYVYPSAEPLNAGPNTVSIVNDATDYYAATVQSIVVSVSPKTPDITFAGEVIDADPHPKNIKYINAIPFGTHLGNVATAVKLSIPGYTPTDPGAISYSFTPTEYMGGFLPPNARALVGASIDGTGYPKPADYNWTNNTVAGNATNWVTIGGEWNVTATTAGTTNFFSNSRTVSLVVTQGVFNVTDISPSAVQPLVGSATEKLTVPFKIKAVAKINDYKIVGSKLRTYNGGALDGTGPTTDSIGAAAKVTVKVVNTNEWAGKNPDTDKFYEVSLEDWTIDDGNSKIGGEAGVAGVLNPHDLSPYTNSVATGKIPYDKFAVGTSFEVQFIYPDTWVEVVDSAKFSWGYVKASKGGTVKSSFTIGTLQPTIVLNPDKDGKTQGTISKVYGSANEIKFGVSINLDGGTLPEKYLYVKATFSGTNFGTDILGTDNTYWALTGEGDGPNYSVWKRDFVQSIYSATAPAYDYRSNYTVWHGDYPVRFKLAADSSPQPLYAAAENTLIVKFTPRKMRVWSFDETAGEPVDGVIEKNKITVTYGNKDNFDAAVKPQFEKEANPATALTERGLIKGDELLRTGTTGTTNILGAVNQPTTIYYDWTAEAGKRLKDRPITVPISQIAFVETVDGFNYDVTRYNGVLSVQRKQLNVVVNDFTVTSNKATPDLTYPSGYKFDGWASGDDTRNSVVATNLPTIPIQLICERPSNAEVGSRWYITNKWAQNLGGNILSGHPTEDKPEGRGDLFGSGKYTILTNYSEQADATDYTHAYSFYVSGPQATNYYVRTVPPYGVLAIKGKDPVVTWTPTDIIYGENFNATNLKNASIVTNGVKVDPKYYKYYVQRTDDKTTPITTVDKVDYLEVPDSVPATSVAFTPNALAGGVKVRLVWVNDSKDPANYDPQFAPVDKVMTINVVKRTMYLSLKQTDPVMNNEVPNANWNIVIEPNGQLLGDPLWYTKDTDWDTTGVATRPPVLARNPNANVKFNVDTQVIKDNNDVKAKVTTTPGSYPMTLIRDGDNGIGSSSNYVVTFIDGTFVVKGKVATSSHTYVDKTDTDPESGWHYTDKHQDYNLHRQYGYYYTKKDLVDEIRSSITDPAPDAANEKQFTVTFYPGDPNKTTGFTLDDNTLMPVTPTNTVVWTFRKDSSYSYLSLTNRFEVTPYPINVFIRWDKDQRWERLKDYRAITNRAYGDDVNLYPALWANMTNFATNLKGLLATDPISMSSFANMAAFDVAEANDHSGNAKTWYTVPKPEGGGNNTITLTNGEKSVTNLWFAVTNETMKDLGLTLYTKADAKTLAWGDPVQVGVKITTDRAPNYTINVLNGKTRAEVNTLVGVTPAATWSVSENIWTPLIAITNAQLQAVTYNQSRAYGSTNYEFKGEVRAFKSNGEPYINQDDITLTFSCEANATSPAGRYDIYSTLNDPKHMLGNYADHPDAGVASKSPDLTTLGTGTLTVTGAVLTATAVSTDKHLPSIRMRIGQTTPVAFNLITGFTNSDAPDVVTVQPTWGVSIPATAKIGDTFPITNTTAGSVALNVKGEYNYTWKYAPSVAVVASNEPPVARNDSITVVQGTQAKILMSKLLANDSSPFGDTLIPQWNEFPKLSARNINVDKDNTKLWIYYNTAALTLDTNGYDSFTYSVKDSLGVSGSGTVFVKVNIATTNYVPDNIKSAVQDPVTGAITLTFVGISGRKYAVQGTADVVHGPWNDLKLFDRNVHASLTGLTDADKTKEFICVGAYIIVTDTDTAAGGRYYRAITPQ